MKFTSMTALLVGAGAVVACAGQDMTQQVETGYTMPQQMQPVQPDQIVQVPVPIAVPVEPPSEAQGRKVSGQVAASMIQRQGMITVDPRQAIGATYTPAWMDGYAIPLYAAINLNTDIEFPEGAYLESLQATDVEDGQSEGESAGWQIKTSFVGRDSRVRYKAHVMPRHPRLKTQITANLTMPDGEGRTMIFDARSFDHTRMVAVRPIMQDLILQRTNDKLSQSRAGGVVRHGADSGNSQICGVGSDAKYRVLTEVAGLEWTQIRPGKVYNDGRMTCIEFPPEGPTRELPVVMVVMPDDTEYTANCSLMGRHYVCDGVPERMVVRGITGGSLLIERTGNG